MSPLQITIRPEFFRLPSRGVDPYFGLSRSYYYELDKTGQVLLVRLRKRGSQRGVALVNFEAMSSFLARAVNRANGIDVPESATPIAKTSPSGNVHRLVQGFPEDVELMRKLTPALLHDVLRTITDLERMQEAGRRGHSS